MISDSILYLLYAFVQGIVVVRLTHSREDIKAGAGGEILFYWLLAPLVTLLLAAYCFALLIRWLITVGKP